MQGSNSSLPRFQEMNAGLHRVSCELESLELLWQFSVKQEWRIDSTVGTTDQSTDLIFFQLQSLSEFFGRFHG